MVIIIVMLILVTVTVNIALNGGIIRKSKQAAKRTQIEAEREELISITLGAYDVFDEINVDDLEEEISRSKTDYTNGSMSESSYFITGPSGTIWEIDLETGDVTESGTSSSSSSYSGSSDDSSYSSSYSSSNDSSDSPSVPEQTQDPIVGVYKREVEVDNNIVEYTYSFIQHQNVNAGGAGFTDSDGLHTGTWSRKL